MQQPLDVEMKLLHVLGVVVCLASVTHGRDRPRFDQAFETQLSSSLRKMRRGLKREFRTKLIPKVVRSVLSEVNAAMDGGTIPQLLLSLDMLQTRMEAMEARIASLDEENASLRRTQQAQVYELREFRAGVIMNCSCDLSSLEDRIAETSMRPTATISKDNTSKDTAASSASGPVIAIGTETTRLIPVNFTASVTLNVSSSNTPDCENQDSLLIVNSNGRMARVSLQDPYVRANLTTEKHVECVVYDPVSRRVFWSRNQPQHTDVNDIYNVFSANVDGSNVRTLLAGKWIVSMAVDGSTRQLFMLAWEPDYHISIMATKGDNYRIVRHNFTISGKPKNIILDTHRKTIFVSFSSDIFQMSYDGSGLRRLVGGFWMKPMALATDGTILYFGDRNNLYSFDLDLKRKDLVYQMKHDMNAFVLHKGMLYVSYQRADVVVDSLSLSKRSVRAFKFIAGEWFRLCLIPA